MIIDSDWRKLTCAVYRQGGNRGSLGCRRSFRTVRTSALAVLRLCALVSEDIASVALELGSRGSRDISATPLMIFEAVHFPLDASRSGARASQGGVA